jgi:hypothetical protein
MSALIPDAFDFSRIRVGMTMLPRWAWRVLTFAALTSFVSCVSPSARIALLS